MALQLLIAGVDRIGYLERGSLRINQDAATYVSTCYFNLIDPNNVITATIKDTLVVEDPVLGEVYFDGTVANVDFDPLGGGTSPKRKVKIQCQDNNILIEEAIVVGPHSYVGVADNAIINALFLAYLPAIDSVINVNLVDGAVTIDFQNITLREALRQLCDQTEAFWFVREDDLYYGVDADFGLVGWFLSDAPDNITSFGYMHDTSRKYHGSNMVNEITVIGILAAAGGITRQDAASIAAYGTHAAITTDNRISTVAGANKRGDAILNEWSMPRESYTVKTMQGGAIAGQRIRYVNSVYGIDATFTIRRLSISFPKDVALYTMALGDDLDLGLLGQRIFLDKIVEALEPITPGDLPLPSRGWVHDLVFTVTDADTVAWAGGGTITAADGTAFAINAGNTGNMAPVTTRYVFLDIAVSLVNLQLADVAANAVGATRILIAVCYPNADAAKDAIFQVFGGEGQEVFVSADNIAANTITANEILANSITGGCMVVGTITALYIAALTITANEIAADTITADKLQIGSLIFDEAEGLLLLGPHCYIADDEWRTLQQQAATIIGAFHQAAGRWIDTRALVIERAVTNMVTNPSFELGVAGGWLAGTNVTMAQSAEGLGFFEDYSLLLTAAGAGVINHYTLMTIAVGATDYTLSAYARESTAEWFFLADSGDAAWHGKWFHLSGAGALGSTKGNINSASIRRFGQWYRCIVTFTRAGAGNLSLRMTPCPGDNTYTFAQAGEAVYVDGVQLEADGWSTSYCDGTLGHDYAWTGAEHASTSTRVASTVNLDAHVGLVASNDTTSYRLVMQMPYDANAVWPREGGYNYFTNARAAGGEIILGYDDTDNKFKVYINGATRLESAAQTFVAGDWIDFVATLDFSVDDYNMYLNGLLVDTDATVLASQAITDWNLGSSHTGTTQAGAAYTEFAVFDKVLTAIEVAQLYNLQRPLVDAGASETPGIYIIDGKFRIASSTSGNRIEITPDKISGYDSAGTEQFYLQASDGKAYCGGGKIWLDSSGINITIAAAPGWIIFSDAGTIRGSILAYTPASPQVYVRSGPASGAALWAELYLQAVANNLSTSEIYVRRTNASGEILFLTGAVYCGKFGYNAAGTGYVYSPGFLSLGDGIAAPATVGGRAHIYVDGADGDLKVKFGDGFVRTIAADS